MSEPEDVKIIPETGKARYPNNLSESDPASRPKTIKLPFRLKLLAGFGVIIFNFLIFVIYDQYQDNNSYEKAKAIYEHPLPVTRAALNAKAGILAMHRSMKDVVLSENNNELEAALAIVNNLENEVLAEFNIIQAKILGEEGKRLAAEAKTSFIGWREIRQKVIDFKRDGKTKEAVAITKGKGADYVRMMSAKKKAMQDYAKGKADIFFSELSVDRENDIFVKSIFLVITLSTSIGLALFISFSFSKRIKDLSDATNDISEGNLSVVVPIEGHDEITSLAINFNRMTGRLSSTLSELESFSYSVSHDLRAPVRHLTGYSQAIIEDYGDKLGEDGKDMLVEINNSAADMGAMIDALLSLSRITRKELVRKQVDMSQLASGIVDELRISEGGRIVEINIKPDVIVNADKGLIKVALKNLLGNALKFSSDKIESKIEFGVMSSDDGDTYFVKDNGAGFDMAYEEKLFKPFERLHSQKEFQGMGVGLSTVKRIIDRHGGRMWAKSAPGEGATFYFTLS